MQPGDAELEMETSPETAMFRKTLLMRWEMLNPAQAEHGAQSDPGAVRAHLSVLVTHAPVAAVAQFVDAGAGWLSGAPGRGHNGDVVALTLCAYPRPTWAKTPALSKEAATDDQTWRAWVQAWRAEFSLLSSGANPAGSVGSRLAKFLNIEGDATMFDSKTLLSSALKLGQMALEVYLGAEENRQRRIAEGGATPSPMTLESVMREAQCHIPGLEAALGAVMGDEQQARECIEAITRTPDLVGVLKVLSGLAARAPEATTAQPPRAPARHDLTATAAVVQRPGPPAFRAEFGPRTSAGSPPDVPAPPVPAEEALRPQAEPVSPPDAPMGVEQELAALESWVGQRSHQARQRGERLAERLGAFLADAGVSIHDTPAPAFVDPPETAEAQAAATSIQPTHFTADSDEALDLHVKALIDRTKRRLERRYNLDDEFLAWLENQFEAVQTAINSRSPSADASAA